MSCAANDKTPDDDVDEEEDKFIDQHLRLVKNCIELCIKRYMSKREAMDTLTRVKNIKPAVTQLVWEKIEEDNPRFFKAYYVKLVLKDQIEQFNRLLLRQAECMESSASVSPAASHASSNSSQHHIPNVITANNSRGMVRGDDMAMQQQLNMFHHYGSPINSSVHNRVIDASSGNLFLSQNPNRGMDQVTNGNHAHGLCQNGNMGLAHAMNGNDTQAFSQNPNIGLAHVTNVNDAQALCPNPRLAQKMNANDTRPVFKLDQAMNGNHAQALSQNTNMGFGQTMNMNHTDALCQNTNMGLGETMNMNHTEALCQNTNMGLGETMNMNHTEALSQNTYARLVQAMNGNHAEALSQNTNAGLGQTMNMNHAEALSQNTNARLVQAMNGNHAEAGFCPPVTFLESQHVMGDASLLPFGCIESRGQHQDNTLSDWNLSFLEQIQQSGDPEFAAAFASNAVGNGSSFGASNSSDPSTSAAC